MNNFDKPPTIVICAVKVIFLSVIFTCTQWLIIILKLFMNSLECTFID
jgi:hypothetical protein